MRSVTPRETSSAFRSGEPTGDRSHDLCKRRRRALRRELLFASARPNRRCYLPEIGLGGGPVRANSIPSTAQWTLNGPDRWVSGG